MLNDDGTLANRQPATLDEHGVESSTEKLALVTDIKVSPSDAASIERHAA